VRGDSFVVETNIHYPTDSSLIADGLRKILKLATALAKQNGLSGWRQQQHLLRKIRSLARKIGQLSRSRAKAKAVDCLKPGYRELLERAKELSGRARQLLRDLSFAVDAEPSAATPKSQEELLLHYLQLTEKVCDNARRRVLEGETLANQEKLFSIFEPHTELLIRGQQPTPIQFGHSVLVVEDAVGFVVEYRVLGKGVLDQDVVVPVMKELQKRFAGKIHSASFDRAFHTPANQTELAKIVTVPCLAMKGREQGRQQQEESTVAFRKARKRHSGVESAIGALQAGNGLKRCRDRGAEGYERYVALGILGRNLQTLGKLLLAQDAATSQAAQSKRQRDSA
jgi:IS5 family transposase